MNIQCPKCGRSLEGDVAPGTPVSCPSCGADFTVPRNAPAPRRGSLVRGIVGAALGAFAGALLWALVGMLGYIAAIVGFVIAWLVTFGYDRAGGPEGLVRVVVVFVAITASVVLANFMQVEWQLRSEFKHFGDDVIAELQADPEFKALDAESQAESLADAKEKIARLSFGEFRSAVLSEPENRNEMLKNTGMGLLFAFLGGFGFLRKKKTEED